MGKAQKRGLEYEKTRTRKLGAKHIGGPGKEDARKGKRKYEIKKWKNPVHEGVIKNAIKKGIKTIIAPGGFTEPAREFAKKKSIKLRR